MNTLRILVLEDHAFQRVAAVSALNSLGYEDIFQAADGKEALSVISQVGGVDIALCDLNMAGMDGLTFLRLAKESGLIRAVIICSSLPEDLLRTVDRIVTLQGLELVGSVGKPLSVEVLQPLLMRYRSDETLATKSIENTPDQPSEYEMLEAIRRQEFRAYFQPKFHLRSGEVDGAEVLVRWQSPSRGLLSPGMFLPTIERCGLLDEMFFSLLTQGLSLQRFVQSHGKPFRLAFNLDVSQMANPNLVDRIKALLRIHGASPAGLIFELTETGLLQMPEVSMENMVRLRMLGFSLAIDDFGVGYSSLERLCQMPFNEIKLDAGFVQNYEQARYSAVIHGALALARELDMRVVAEGIETADQARHLDSLGCRWGQGFFYARPMNWAHLVDWRFEGEKSSWRRAIGSPDR
ncbi:EAL domain-containing response regulator [Pseudomonas sp. A34-9]|uniref:EAL domain-containing response regulator n=1 Tax=Pseudomonas sp. A34-9 TaxID=3034675 RepID=UPI00240E3B0A|nr:EAL domain-containing response regulator [Pseudomonas sp. A34-9]